MVEIGHELYIVEPDESKRRIVHHFIDKPTGNPEVKQSQLLIGAMMIQLVEVDTGYFKRPCQKLMLIILLGKGFAVE